MEAKNRGGGDGRHGEKRRHATSQLKAATRASWQQRHQPEQSLHEVGQSAAACAVEPQCRTISESVRMSDASFCREGR